MDRYKEYRMEPNVKMLKPIKAGETNSHPRAKVPGAKPGMVIYHSYRTVIVNPYREIVVDALNAEKKTEAE